MALYYKFLEEAFFSAGKTWAHVGDVFTFDDQTLRGRFRGYDFKIPKDYIDNLAAEHITQQISFYEFLELLGLPPIDTLINYDALAAAIMANEGYIALLGAQVAAILKMDPDFLLAVKGDKGDPGLNGTNGTNGRDGVSPSPQDVANVLKGDPAFLASVRGDPGPQGVPGSQGVPGIPGLSFGAFETISKIIDNGDRVIASDVWTPVPGLDNIQVTTVSLQERMLFLLETAAYSLVNDQTGRWPISLDIEVDGTRISGSYSGLLTVRLAFNDEQNMSFTVPSFPVGPGIHVVKLLFRSANGIRMALRGTREINQTRLNILRF